MNFMSDALEKSAGEGMKRMLGRIAGNRFSGVGIGAGVTAIIQSSSATSVMVIGLVNAGVMTLMQATPILMGAKIGTTITGILVSLKNDYFDMAMYLLAFAGIMMGFAKKEKIKLAGLLCSGLGLIFVGLNIMSSGDAFGNRLVKDLFQGIFQTIDFPLLLVLVGVIFTALIQSSSAATGVVITMVGTGVMELHQALFIVLGANLGTCVTALLASVGTNTNAKRVTLIYLTFTSIGMSLFTALVWIFKTPFVNLLTSFFPGDDPMSMQMRVSSFHVLFNVSTTALLLPFVKPLVNFSERMIKEKKTEEETMSLKFVDDRLITTPPVALMQVKKEMDYMFSLVEENVSLSFAAMETEDLSNKEKVFYNEKVINFTNSNLTKFLIKLSSTVEQRAEQVIGSYFHVLNDLERIGDHAENFFDIATEMANKKIAFSSVGQADMKAMRDTVMQMLKIAKDTFDSLNTDRLEELTALEEQTDNMKREFTAAHFARLAEGHCSMAVSPYYASAIAGLERVGDHLVNVGYSIVNPVGSQSEN
jgi:phosphate:Na+ symporter